MKYKFGSALSRVLIIVLLVTGSAAYAEEPMPELGELEFTGESLVLPMNARTGHPLVIVDLGDGEEHHFVVDTGASVNVIDGKIAEGLGYQVIGELDIGAPGGAKITGNVVQAPDVLVGGATIAGAEFVTIDLNTFSAGTMQGVLGLGLFRNYLLTYDYGKSERIVRIKAIMSGARPSARAEAG